jgi:hypothetical protein
MKKNFVLLLILLIQLVYVLPAFADVKASPPTVTVDGDKLDFSVAPIIEDGTTLVQFRPIFEKLGLKIEWDGTNKRITGTKEGLKIELKFGSITALLNGKEITLQKAPRLVNGITVIPLRFVGEASGKIVNWDASTQSVSIRDKTSDEAIANKPTDGTTIVTSTTLGKDDASNSNLKQKVEQELLELEKRSKSFYENKNLEGFLSTIDENNPAFKSDWKNGAFSSTFQSHIELVSFKVLDFTENTAKAETVEIYSNTYAGSSSISKQKRTSNTIYRKSKNGEWKIAGAVGILLLENVSPPQPVPDGLPKVKLSSGENKAVINVGESLYVQVDHPTTLYLVNQKMMKATMTLADYENEVVAQRAKKLIIALSDINKSLELATTGLVPGFYEIIGGGNSILWNEISVTSSPVVISVKNNPIGTDDTVTVSSLIAGDIVHVSTEGGTLKGNATVAEGQTTATISIKQLGIGAGTIFITVTSIGKAESTPTIFIYSAESGVNQ